LIMARLTNEGLKVIEYARILAAKQGVVIPENSYGKIEWVKVGKVQKAKSVSFLSPLINIKIPNWDWVPQKRQKELL